MAALSGKVIISTRPVTDNDQIHRRLAEEGATVIHIPMIEISAAPINKNTDKAFQELGEYHWIIFTSSNGVKHFFKAFKNNIFPNNLKIASYGNRTNNELYKLGFSADFTYHGGTSSDFYNAFCSQIKKSDKILLVQGNLAPNLLKNELSSIATVQRIDVYQTSFTQNVDPQKLKWIIENKYDLILFTSPSGFESFMAMLEDDIDLAKLRVISIGKRTSQAIGNSVHRLITAETPDADGIINGILKYDQNT